MAVDEADDILNSDEILTLQEFWLCPFDPSDENIDAPCKNGVLATTINKTLEINQKVRKIEIINSQFT